MHLIFILFSFSLIFSDDFDSKVTIGGYGELHWNKSYDNDGNMTKNTLDFHRFIIFTGYNFDTHWSFKSELEIEHNMIDGNGDYDGEVELEQAYVNYHSEYFGFQAGVLLPTVGLINEYHEPPLFLSVERPLYNKYIIPTTWFANGFSIYGSLSDFKWRFALLEDLDGSKIENGIRAARGKGYKTTGYDLVKNFSLSYSGYPGLRLGFSTTINNAPESFNDDGTVSSSIGITLTEFNAKFEKNNFYSVFEYGTINYDTSNFIVSEDDPNTDENEYNNFNFGKSSGYYIDFGYNIGSILGVDKLMPWIRLSNVSRDENNESMITDLQRIGLTWWPTDQIAFKIDYAKLMVKADSNSTSEFNLGVGYNF